MPERRIRQPALSPFSPIEHQGSLQSVSLGFEGPFRTITIRTVIDGSSGNLSEPDVFSSGRLRFDYTHPDDSEMNLRIRQVFTDCTVTTTPFGLDIQTVPDAPQDEYTFKSVDRGVGRFNLQIDPYDPSQDRKMWVLAPGEAVERIINATGLSDREIAVLLEAANGVKTSDTASKLMISPHTVRAHVKNSTAKLGVGGKLEAVTWAMKNGVFRLVYQDESVG